MNRMDEYTALLAELEQTPKELDHTVNKALNRKNALQKKRRFFGTSLGGLAACFAAFVLLVNLSTPFARACGRIPLLADLAKAVSWSPSLSAAVENDYVQPLRLSQSQNGITARVEYLIVDRKQVDVFFSVQSDDYAHLDLDHPTLTVPGEQEGYASSFSSYGIENGDLMELRIDFMNRDVPDSLTTVSYTHLFLRTSVWDWLRFLTPSFSESAGAVRRGSQIPVPTDLLLKCPRWWCCSASPPPTRIPASPRSAKSGMARWTGPWAYSRPARRRPRTACGTGHRPPPENQPGIGPRCHGLPKFPEFPPHRRHCLLYTSRCV